MLDAERIIAYVRGLTPAEAEALSASMVTWLAVLSPTDDDNDTPDPLLSFLVGAGPDTSWETGGTD